MMLVSANSRWGAGGGASISQGAGGVLPCHLFSTHVNRCLTMINNSMHMIYPSQPQLQSGLFTIVNIRVDSWNHAKALQATSAAPNTSGDH